MCAEGTLVLSDETSSTVVRSWAGLDARNEVCAAQSKSHYHLSRCRNELSLRSTHGRLQVSRANEGEGATLRRFQDDAATEIRLPGCREWTISDLHNMFVCVQSIRSRCATLGWPVGVGCPIRQKEPELVEVLGIKSLDRGDTSRAFLACCLCKPSIALAVAR